MLAKRIPMALGAAVLAFALTGCAKPPPELARAENAYETISSNEEIASNASVELYEAGKTLDRAQAAWNLRRNKEEAQHLAYVTEQQVELARAAARRKQAEGDIERLSQERQAILYQARSAEAETQRQRAEARAQEAEERAREALLARQAAQQAAEEAEKRLKEAEVARARVTALEREIEAMGAQMTDRGIVLTLGDVLFDLNKAELRSGAERNLERLVQFLNEHPDRSVVVEGHTDSTGEASYNLDLSQRRARAVRIFLLENGVAANRIISKGYGETYPVASNGTAAGRQQNRRVEVVILDAGEDPSSAERTAPVGSR